MDFDFGGYDDYDVGTYETGYHYRSSNDDNSDSSCEESIRVGVGLGMAISRRNARLANEDWVSVTNCKTFEKLRNAILSCQSIMHEMYSTSLFAAMG